MSIRTHTPETLEAYRVLVESADEAIFVADFETALFVDANRVALDLFGYDLAELRTLTGRNLSALPPAEHKRLSNELIEHGLAVCHDIPLMRKDGTQFHADLWVKRFTFDGRDYHVNIVRDTTERVTRGRMLEDAQSRLLASEATYRGLVTSLDEAVVIVDHDTHLFLEANPAAVELFGYSLDEWRTIRGADLHPPSEASVVDALSRRARQSGSAHLARTTMKRKDGSAFQADMRLNVYDAAGRTLIVAVIRNISAQVEQQAELARSYAELRDAQAKLLHTQKLAAVGEVAAGVAHEINNPAAFVAMNHEAISAQLDIVDRLISSLAELSAGDSEHARQVATLLAQQQVDMRGLRAMIDDNREGIERIRSVTRDLRVFSRVEQSEAIEVNLNDVVRSTTNLLHNELRHRARLSLDLAPLAPIVADHGKLAQVVTNLLLNAAHAIQEGAAEKNEIRVITRLGDGHVSIVVEDTGTGMSEEVRARIFDPFFTTKPREQGTGLGLSLCADIVAKHRGEMHVTSALGEGSRFEVRIPFDTGMEPRRASPAPPVSTLRGSRRIMVIDDDDAMVRAYRRLLAGFDAVIVDSGQGALEAIEDRGAPDLVLCDLMMPEMDGPQVYEAIGARWPTLLRRIVFCTGGAFTPRARQFLAGIDNAVLDKPITIEQIERLLSSHELDDAALSARGDDLHG